MNKPSATTTIPPICRADYKRIKSMDRAALTEHLFKVYLKGVEKGREIERAAVTASGGEK